MHQKFLCVNCVKHFKDDDVFVRNQYCTGFCMLLHVRHASQAMRDEHAAKAPAAKHELQAA